MLHGGDDPVTEVGEGATIGHMCVVHGAVIGAEALVGNGATVLDACEHRSPRPGRGGCHGAAWDDRLGRHARRGVPARITGQVTGRALEWVDTNPAIYRELARRPRRRGPTRRAHRVVTMEYRALGKSGLRVSALTMGTMTFGGSGAVRQRRVDRRGPGPPPGGHVPGRRASTSSTPRTSTQAAWPRRSWGRSCGPPGPRAGRHQGPDADGPRAERRRPLTAPRHRRLRGQPAPSGHRLHRPVPGARVGRADPARGDPAGARPAGRARARSATSAPPTTPPGS